jgi:hypothetical protein
MGQHQHALHPRRKSLEEPETLSLPDPDETADAPLA